MFHTLGTDSSLFHDQAVKVKEILLTDVRIVWDLLKDIGIHSLHLRLLSKNIAYFSLWQTVIIAEVEIRLLAPWLHHGHFYKNISGLKIWAAVSRQRH
jgi:hypothetical protein